MKPRFKLADAKSLDLKEQWDLMKKLLSVLQLTQTATLLLSAETSPTASVCFSHDLATAE